MSSVTQIAPEAIEFIRVAKTGGIVGHELAIFMDGEVKVGPATITDVSFKFVKTDKNGSFSEMEIITGRSVTIIPELKALCCTKKLANDAGWEIAPKEGAIYRITNPQRTGS